MWPRHPLHPPPCSPPGCGCRTGRTPGCQSCSFLSKIEGEKIFNYRRLRYIRTRYRYRYLKKAFELSKKNNKAFELPVAQKNNKDTVVLNCNKNIFHTLALDNKKIGRYV